MIMKFFSEIHKGWREGLAEKKAEKARRKQMHVYRTKEGTIFEIVCAVLLIIAWTLNAWIFFGMGHDIPVPKHLFLSGMFTIVTIALLVTAYHPQYIDTIDKIGNQQQLLWAVRSVRIIAIFMALFAMLPPVIHIYHSPIPHVGLPIIILMILTQLFVSYKAKRA